MIFSILLVDHQPEMQDLFKIWELESRKLSEQGGPAIRLIGIGFNDNPQDTAAKAIAWLDQNGLPDLMIVNDLYELKWLRDSSGAEKYHCLDVIDALKDRAKQTGRFTPLMVLLSFKPHDPKLLSIFYHPDMRWDKNAIRDIFPKILAQLGVRINQNV